MNTSEARTLINLERCDGVSIHEVEQGTWAIYIQPAANLPIFPESTWLETSRGETRTFASLDTAVTHIRTLGWDMPILLS